MPNAKTTLFEEDGIIKGFISVIEYSFIGALFVDPPYQGHGIGRRLLDHVFSQYQHLSLTVYKDNLAAVQFYQKYGFKIMNEQLNQDSGKLEYLMQK